MKASSSARGAIRRIAIFAALLSLGACSPIGRSREPTMFVPDQRLYEQIAEIDHVTSVSAHYSKTMENGPMYSGEVVVDATANPLCVLDQVYAILWQGRFAALDVGVVQGDTYVDGPALSPADDSVFVSHQQWIDRYGPHPRAGASPKPSPRPTPPPGGPCG